VNVQQIEDIAISVEEIFFLVGIAILAIELLKLFTQREMKGTTLLDMLASFSTQVPSILIETLVFGAALIGYQHLAEHYVTWTLSLDVWTFALTLLLCDFVYYWEHRLAHEIRLAWTQHAVHHSSRFMNISVAVRFGPFEGVLSAILHTPLVLLGLPPEAVAAGILIVLAYQVWIHTETIGRLGVLESFLNTPSHHRVHHGCDEKYLDRNYGGVLIVWDKLFGTFQVEEETPRYGLKRDFDSVNPLLVWVSELPGLFRDVVSARSVRELGMRLFAHPSWEPEPQTASVPHTDTVQKA